MVAQSVCGETYIQPLWKDFRAHSWNFCRGTIKPRPAGELLFIFIFILTLEVSLSVGSFLFIHQEVILARQQNASYFHYSTFMCFVQLCLFCLLRLMWSVWFVCFAENTINIFVRKRWTNHRSLGLLLFSTKPDYTDTVYKVNVSAAGDLRQSHIMIVSAALWSLNRFLMRK